MKREKWHELTELLNLPACSFPHFGLLSRRYSVPEDTLGSIYSQENQRRIIQSGHRFQEQSKRIHREYVDGGEFVDLCCAYNWPSCFLIRRLLELPPFCLGRQRITEVLRDPGSILQAKPSDSLPEQAWDKAVRRMHGDIQAAILCDPSNSPEADVTRRELGLRYEDKLAKDLDQRGVAFWSEDALRSKGYFKTPDAKLQVPCLYAGQIITWIDSKACFGGEYIHQQQSQDQFQKYVNRYGSGMVIYWFGFIEEMAKDETNIVLVSEMPPSSALIMLPCLELTE